MKRMRYSEANGLPLIHAGGDYRVLAALPGRASYPSLAPWHASKPVIPRDQWREVSWRAFNSPILDQGRSSACTGFSTAAAFHRCWSISGQRDISPSPWFLYGLCDRGVDQGAIVGDLLAAAQQFGCALNGNLADGDMPEHFWTPAQLQALPEVLAKAQRYKPLEAYHLQPQGSIFDELASALLCGFQTVFGILVYQNFSQVTADGSVPAPQGRVLGGHALTACGLRHNQRLNKWELETQNSWSQAWGLQGMCYLGEEHFVGQTDAFALTAAQEDVVEDTTWPVAKVA
jgi:Papain family cysteine protease